MNSPWTKALIAIVVIGVVGAALAVPVSVILTQTTRARGKYQSQRNANMDKNYY